MEMMSWEEVFICLVLLAALTSFVMERIPTDMTAIIAFGLLMVAGFLPVAETLPNMEQLLAVFSNPAPLAIAALFILSAALEKCGLIDVLARRRSARGTTATPGVSRPAGHNDPPGRTGIRLH